MNTMVFEGQKKSSHEGCVGRQQRRRESESTIHNHTQQPIKMKELQEKKSLQRWSFCMKVIHVGDNYWLKRMPWACGS